ncbi:zinc-binding metallopeptidase family protein [Halobaculum gomorrense]|uniref:Endoglucanase n=1 Tax=Halobaculum gomorrense TaxID=43928 RepID=A0A1M5S4P4_9EURY|nr:M42 family peptidase [Halobaculum gomorrense]SHH33410.1 endoglucanase [Halobaculum gomorrense]
MESVRRAFLDDLLTTPSPSGFETDGQRVWVEYVRRFADDVWTDAYGNAVAVHEGGGDGPEIAFAGHADEIGFMIRRITDEGFVRLTRVGGSDRTVSKGQHVTVHAAEGPVQGVIGQTAIHLRDPENDDIEDVSEQFVDIGADDEAAASELVEVGDPVTFSSTVHDLHGDRIAARGMDNRVGTWAVAEGLRRAVDADADATVYAVSTVQEEIGLNGAEMVGFDLDPDVAVAADVTHATDNPDMTDANRGPVELGAGPVVARGSANHPRVVELARRAADAGGIDYQLQAAGIRTGTDADAFFTSRGGTPSLNVGIPNRYMHTPVEVIDAADLVAVADLFGSMAARAPEFVPFAVDI